MRRTWASLNALYFLLVVVSLYLPLVLLIVFSFNDSRSLTFPLSGFTLQWYAELWKTPELLRATWNSVVLGVASSAVATVIGAMAAVALVRFRFVGRKTFIAVAMMPLVIPSVILGVALLIGFMQIGLAPFPVDRGPRPRRDQYPSRDTHRDGAAGRPVAHAGRSGHGSGAAVSRPPCCASHCR